MKKQKNPKAKFDKMLGIFRLSETLIIINKDKRMIIGYYNKNNDTFYENKENFKIIPIEKESIVYWDYLDLKKIFKNYKKVINGLC